VLWQAPPKPLNRVLVSTGPYSTPPLLLNTAKPLLTVWTSCVGPTAASVSGGADCTVNPLAREFNVSRETVYQYLRAGTRTAAST